MQNVSGVPASSVGTVVQDFIDNGASRVVVEISEDGTFNVSAG